MEWLKNFFSKKDSPKIDLIDIAIIGVVLVIYGIFSFINLGSTKNPQTFVVDDKANIEHIFKVSSMTSKATKIRYFVGPKPGSYSVYASKDGKNYKMLGKTSSENYVFGWYDLEFLPISDLKYIKLVSNSASASLGEIKLDNVKLSTSDNNSNKLIDEQDTVPDIISYKNSTYFDEVYFARAAYEYANGLPTYEWVHPPLSKLIQAIPVKLFGMTPFNYRFMGNVSGILLILVMYLFAKALFKNRGFALLAALFMTFDNFHFAQSRIGTMDIHLTLFILLSYYFMYRYMQLDSNTKLSRKLLFLGFSGVSVACAIATKWTGLFAGLGLAILFFIHFYRTYFLGKKKVTNKEKKEMKKIIGSCFIFFIFIPIILYLGCYFLFPFVSTYKIYSLKDLFDITSAMYKYHSTLNATHPFSSEWYTWPFMLKPVWYYSGNELLGMRSTISGLGNIVIWWSGVLAIIYCFYKAYKKDNVSFVLVIAFICLYFPYVEIGRCMFLYHYFPVLPFVMLALTKLVKDLVEKTRLYLIIPIFICIVILCFIYFLPVTSGMTISNEKIESMRWLPDWYF